MTSKINASKIEPVIVLALIGAIIFYLFSGPKEVTLYESKVFRASDGPALKVIDFKPYSSYKVYVLVDKDGKEVVLTNPFIK